MNKIKIIGVSDEKHHSGSLYTKVGNGTVHMLVYINDDSEWAMVELVTGTISHLSSTKENAMKGFTFLGHDMNIELKP